MDEFNYLGGPISRTEVNSSVPIRRSLREKDIYILKLKGEGILMAHYDKLNLVNSISRLQIAARLANYDRVVELVEEGVDVFSQYPKKHLIESEIAMQPDTHLFGFGL